MEYNSGSNHTHYFKWSSWNYSPDSSLNSTPMSPITIITKQLSYYYCVVPENIHTPITEGIGNSRGVGGSKALEIPEGLGLTVKWTSRWFSLIQYQPTAVVVRKLLLTDCGGRSEVGKGFAIGVCNKGLQGLQRNFFHRRPVAELKHIPRKIKVITSKSWVFANAKELFPPSARGRP